MNVQKTHLCVTIFVPTLMAVIIVAVGLVTTWTWITEHAMVSTSLLLLVVALALSYGNIVFIIITSAFKENQDGHTFTSVLLYM